MLSRFKKDWLIISSAIFCNPLQSQASTKNSIQNFAKNLLMAYAGKKISNQMTGQEILFLRTAKDTDGCVLEMVSTWEPHSTEPLQHYHPVQSEDFEVTSGELTVRLSGKTYLLKKGDRLHIPPNTKHAMWNASGEKTSVHWKISPALQTEYFFETGMGLAADGKSNKNGLPPFLQTVLLAKKYNKEFRLSKPSYTVQRVLFYLLAPVARISGYKSVYKHHLD